MKAHWFTVLNVAGIFLLVGQGVGGELQWKKPVNDQAAVIRIPAATAANKLMSPLPSPVRQVQAVQPIQLPIQPAVPTQSQLDMQYPELRPQNLPVPPGAALHNVDPLPSSNVPVIVEPLHDVDPLPSPKVPVTVEPVQTNNPSVNPTNSITRVPCDGQIPLKSIREISHDIRPATTGRLPEECVMNSAPYNGRHFSQSCVQWKASAVCTKAAYFEDVQLERYGHTVVDPAFQPILSGAKFFATIPFLPYKMGVTPPNECVYSLGYYRSGSRSPYMAQPIPISARGMLLQAGAIGGAVAVIP